MARSHNTMGTSSDFCIQNWGDRCVNLLQMSHDLSPNCWMDHNTSHNHVIIWEFNLKGTHLWSTNTIVSHSLNPDCLEAPMIPKCRVWKTCHPNGWTYWVVHPSFKLLLMAMSWLFQVPISPKSPKEIMSFKYVCLVSCRWGLLNKCFKTSFFCLPYSQNIFSKSHIWQFHVCDDQCWVVLTFSVRTFKVFNPVLITINW